MTFTFAFTVPYTLASDGSRLDAARQQAASNLSAESDLSGFSGSRRTVEGNRVEWTLKGVDPADLSAASRQAIIDAIQDNLPGAAQFEIVSES